MGSDPIFEARRLHLLTSMRRVCLILAVAAVVTACGASPAQQAVDARARAGSWAATIATVVDAWNAGIVPTQYVRSTLNAASKDVTTQAAQVRTDAGDAAAGPLLAVVRAIPRVQDAVAQGDRRSARQAVAALRQAVPPPPPPPTPGTR